MMTSRGTMETFFTTVSRSLSSSTKWVGTPCLLQHAASGRLVMLVVDGALAQDGALLLRR